MFSTTHNETQQVQVNNYTQIKLLLYQVELQRQINYPKKQSSLPYKNVSYGLAKF